MSYSLNTIREVNGKMVITEDGVEYICKMNPGITAADRLIADFHPIGNYKRTFLVEAFQDEETLEMTFKAFTTQEEMANAWHYYEEVMDCM